MAGAGSIHDFLHRIVSFPALRCPRCLIWLSMIAGRAAVLTLPRCEPPSALAACIDGPRLSRATRTFFAGGGRGDVDAPRCPWLARSPLAGVCLLFRLGRSHSPNLPVVPVDA